MAASIRASDFHILSREDKSEAEAAAQARMRALPTVRSYHSSAPMLYNGTPPVERSAVAITLGLGALSAGAYAASSAVNLYNEWQASRPVPTEEEKASTESTAKAGDSSQQGAKNEEKKKEGPRENIFAKWFDVGGKYYEGGFEDSMTRREAALILGVRESSSAQRIKDAHRKLLILNHPDTGGSTYIAGKINEAKELLLKGKSKPGQP
jgi:DnaJ homolog subfamily C member 19